VNVEDKSHTELVSMPGYGSGVEWSPDGAKILYGANSDIYVMNADGSQQTNITHSEYSELYPRWSPDGSKIAYIGGPDDSKWEIYVMDANGANLTRVTYNEFDEQTYTWSPDGAYLVFDGATQPYTSLHVIASTGGTPKLLSANLNTGGYYAVSPDETKIAFIHDTLSERDLYLANLDGSHLSQLTVGEQVDYFVWSPNGQRLALYLDHKGLYVIDANATGVTDSARISTAEMLLTFQWLPDHVLPDQVLPDSNQLSFVSNGDIYLVDADNGNLTRLTTEGFYGSPSVAPAERTLAFLGGPESGLALYTFAIDGEGLRKVTNVEGDTPGSALWSPDGSKIIYTSSTMPGFAAKGGEPSADFPQPAPSPIVKSYIINADGSGRRFLSDTAYVRGWTPDGQWIRIGTSLVSSDGLRKIEFGPSGPALGQWSPESQCVLYAVPDELGLYTNVSLYTVCLNLPPQPAP
jgi:Tol biopolymer transport system component